MTALIQKLSTNISGKDYIIGDLHGCYQLLDRLLHSVNFDINADRIFSVGDLIDRGPHSLSCLRLLTQPWFYAVQGNHEAMLLDGFADYLNHQKLLDLEEIQNSDFMYNGGSWVLDYIDANDLSLSTAFNEVLKLASRMPLIYIVGEGTERFNVLHAELTVPQYQTAVNPVWLDKDIDQWLQDNDIAPAIESRLLWSRTLMGEPDPKRPFPKIQPGLSPTFCGHTIAKKPKQFLSHVCLDTGAFQSLDYDVGYCLSLYDVKAAQCYSTSYQDKQVIVTDYKLT